MRPNRWTPALRLSGREQILGAKAFSPKLHALVFQVGPDATPMTMVGVGFPLDMIFLDRAYRVLTWVEALPGEVRIQPPKGTWTVVEVPTGRARRWGIRRRQTMRVRMPQNTWN